MNLALVLPTVLSVLFGGAYMANEWSHGMVAESVGLDHHHAHDFGQCHMGDHPAAGNGSVDAGQCAAGHTHEHAEMASQRGMP